MTIKIEKVIPVHSGEGISLAVLLSSEEQSERRQIILSLTAYQNAGKPQAGDTFEISDFEELEFEAQIYDCMRRGLYLLSFGDNNRAALTRKLCEKGYDRECAKIAAERLFTLGYIDEAAQAQRRILFFADKKLYGRHRIISEMYKRGFPRGIIQEVLSECEQEIDYQKNMDTLLQKKFGITADRLKQYDRYDTKERKEYEKIRGFLYRYGY